MTAAERDRAARKAIEDRRVLGTPLVLYLRKFKANVRHGRAGATQYETLEALLQKAVPAGVKVVSVQDQTEFAESQFDRQSLVEQGWIATTPSLLLRDDEWEATVHELVQLADLIVSEINELSPAVVDELRWCLGSGKMPQTVLVLPPFHAEVFTPFNPDHAEVFEVLDPDPTIQRFFRCTWANAFHWSDLHEMVAFADLLDRLSKLNSLTPAERQKALSDDERRALFPIELGRLADALVKYAVDAEMFGVKGGVNPSPHDSDLAQHEKFWSHLRAIAIFKYQANTLKLFDISAVSNRLAECYVKAGYILLNDNHASAGEFAEIGLKYARMSGQWWLIELAEGLARNLGIPTDEPASSEGTLAPGSGADSGGSAESKQTSSSEAAAEDMDLQKRFAIVVVPPNEKGYRVLLMKLSGKSEFDFEDGGFILTQQPTRDAQVAYAVGLAEMMQIRVMEIKE